MKINLKFFPHYARFKKKVTSIPIQGTPKRIVILSDTHISRDPIFNREIYEKGIEEIRKIKNVDYYIHLGDITQEGTLLEYEYALKLMKFFKDKENFYCIPGNHDSKNVGYLLYEEFFGNRTFEIDDKNLYILGIDSSIPDQDSGKVGLKALERTKDTFLNQADKTKIFCFHHQLIPIPLTGRERSTVIDSGDVLKMILDSNIDIVFNGHRHISNVYSCTDGKEELVVFNSGTFSCNKTRYKELFTYTIVDIFQKAVLFQTKKIYNGALIERGRYINRIFNPIEPEKDKELYLKLIHIANTHISANNFNKNTYQNAVKQINSMNADILIHCGDITNANKIEEFEDAIHYLNKIETPKIIIPGDNDLITIGWDLFPKILGSLEPFFENDKFRIIGINSVDKWIKNGNVGRKKIRDIIQLVKGKKDNKINIVSLYHNLIPHPKTKFQKMLSDSGNVIKFFTDPDNKINFVLTGHDHISFALQLEDTIMSSCGTFSSNDFLDLEGNTFNVINCYKSGLVEVYKHIIEQNASHLIGQYWIDINL